MARVGGVQNVWPGFIEVDAPIHDMRALLGDEAYRKQIALQRALLAARKRPRRR